MTYRILSLDGGGIWALIQVKALMALPGYDENTSGHTVLNDFDLVAANSGGSIVLGALIENLTLRQILALFESESQRKKIFSLAGLMDVVLHDLTENLAQVLPRTLIRAASCPSIVRRTNCLPYGACCRPWATSPLPKPPMPCAATDPRVCIW